MTLQIPPSEEQLAAMAQCEHQVGLDKNVPLFMQIELKKEEVPARIYSILKAEGLLTLDAIRKNSLFSLSRMRNAGGKSIKGLKELVLKKGGWFVEDHADPAFVNQQMIKGQASHDAYLAELMQPSPLPIIAEDETLKKISVIKLLGNEMDEPFGITTKPQKEKHSRMRNQIALRFSLFEKEDSVFALRGISQQQMLRAGVGKATVSNFVSFIHNIGGRFKDDINLQVSNPNIKEFYETHKTIIGIELEADEAESTLKSSNTDHQLKL